jgi:hypothetical protein
MTYRVFHLDDGRRAHIESYRTTDFAAASARYDVHLYISGSPGLAKKAYGRRWNDLSKESADDRVDQLVTKYQEIGAEESNR